MTALLLLLACAPEDAARPPPPAPADHVILGPAYTVNPAQPWAEAVALRGGEIVYVGDAAGVAALQGPNTSVHQLTGDQTLLPGMHDAHVHILESFHPAVQCVVRGGQGATAIARQASRCRVSPGTGWVLGWGVRIDDLLFARRNPKAYLDAWFPRTPVAIMEETSHATWVNSEALRLLGIDASTPDPVGGVISRDPRTGAPDGLLLDSAGELPWDLALLPNPTLMAQNERALRAGLAAANRSGITSLCDARAYWQRGHLEAWEAVEAAGDLSVRAIVGLWAYPTMDTDLLITELTARYRNVPGDRLRFSQVKLYADGITINTTAALLDPYLTWTFAGPRGLFYFDRSRMERLVGELGAVGFDMHIHTIGDGAVHEALNAIELAGLPGHRHRLTHMELVDPADVPRFAALGVTADVQASEWTLPAHVHDLDLFLGARRVDERAWPLRDLYDSGAHVVLSSDYDVGDLSPFQGMARAVDRGPQSLPDVAAAIRAYTVEPARLMRQETLVGSIEVGKRADLIVVDRSPLTTPDLGGTQVLLTLLDGQPVYRGPGF
jgi:predicted amidohydrolase YtcJ